MFVMKNVFVWIGLALCLCYFSNELHAQSVQMIQLGEGIYMHPSKNVLEIRGVSVEDLLTQSIDEMALCQKLSALFKDDFDAYVFVFNLEGNETSLGGYTALLNNSVKGIGLDIFSCEQLSNLHRWKGYITLTGLRNLFSGPLLHEICHLYAAPNLGQVEVNAQGEECLTGGHWGVSDVHGQLGGFDASTLLTFGNNYQATCWIASFFNEDFNGFNTQGICSWKYAPLELYLMGLASINEVPDVHVYKGLSNTNSGQIKKNGSFSAKEVITYTQEDLIAKWGVRVPDYKDSPKEFSILPVVLTDDPLTEYQWSLVQEDIAKQELKGATGEEWPINYWEATQGRGSIKMSGIDKSLNKEITAIESINESILHISGEYVCSEKEIVEIRGYEWSGKLLESRHISTYEVNLRQVQGDVLLFRFADGTFETIKRLR